MITLMKKIVKKIVSLLNSMLSVNPKKSRSIIWYEDEIYKDHEFDDKLYNIDIVFDEIDWKKNKKVYFSGVCIFSEAKVLVFQSLGNDMKHPGFRKTIVFNKYYRPLRYPTHDVNLYRPKYILKNLCLLFKTRNKAKIKGRAALLGNRGFSNDNYYHFWADVISDIWYIRRNIPPSELPNTYLVPFVGLAWQWDILHSCGLRDDQIIPCSRYDVLSFEKLIIPFRDRGAVNLPPWLSSAIHQMSGWSPKTVKGTRLIFVSRADATRRRVVNEAVIRERLVQEGFEVYTLDGMSFREQQSLFASASIICAPHGAALTNLVWCGPGTVVIDLLSEQHLTPCFKELAEQNQVVYYPCVCKKVESEDLGIEGDIAVSVCQIEFVMNIVAKHSPLSNNSNDASVGFEELTKK